MAIVISRCSINLQCHQTKTEFSLIGLPRQLSEVSDPFLIMPFNVTIASSDSTHKPLVICDSSLTMFDHISSLSKSCFLIFRDLLRIRNTLDSTTARTVATSLLYTKLKVD